MIEVAFEALLHRCCDSAASAQNALLELSAGTTVELLRNAFAFQQIGHPIVGSIELIPSERLADIESEPLKVCDCCLPIGFVKEDAGSETKLVLFLKLEVIEPLDQGGD